MKDQRTNNELLSLLGEAKLDAKSIKGLPNDKLWEAIQARQKRPAFYVARRKLVLSIAIGTSLAAVAMYSSYHYIKPEKPRQLLPVEMPAPKALPILADTTAPEKSTLNTEKKPVQPAAKEVKKNTAPLLPTKTPVAIIDTTAKDSIEISKTISIDTTSVSSLEEINDQLQLSAQPDTAPVEKKVVYMKAQPVKIQTKKVKYVKRKKDDKK